jgi:magnesium chelatase family protein
MPVWSPAAPARVLRMVTTRLCRAPPHTFSALRLIGGGLVALPVKVSLAHHGMLWLDVRPVCRRVLEGLR